MLIKLSKTSSWLLISVYKKLYLGHIIDMKGIGAIFDLKGEEYLKEDKFRQKSTQQEVFHLFNGKACWCRMQYRSQIYPDIILVFSIFPVQDVIQAFLLLPLFSLALEMPTLFDTKMTNHWNRGFSIIMGS